MNLPVISIITVVYNGESLLAGTIESVLSQTYPHIEYIIVDGNSKDNTKSILLAYQHRISKWISEPDKGIYDAMSKGLQLASGDFVWYLNCGDHLFKNDIIEQMIKHWTPDTDVLYGDAMLVNDAREYLGLLSEVTVHRLPKELSWKSMKLGMNVCHQSFIAKRVLAEPYMTGNLVADLDWVIKILKKSQKTVNTGLVLSEFLSGGISKQQHRKSLKDRYMILRLYFGFFPNLYHHLLIVIRAILFKFSRSGKISY